MENSQQQQQLDLLTPVRRKLVNTPPPKGGGFRLRLKAGLVRLRRTWRPSLGHVEVVVWFRWRLILDVVNPHLIGHVAAAHNPVAPRPQMLANLHRKRRDPIRLKAWGFPIPYRGL